MILEITVTFLKWSRGTRNIETAASNYIKSGMFFIDVLATVPPLLSGESINVYWLKLFRIVHFLRILEPIDLVLSYILKSLSKKRQDDLISFTNLIVVVVYLSHIMACSWLHLGY
jgi:hypothetical protein